MTVVVHDIGMTVAYAFPADDVHGREEVEDHGKLTLPVLATTGAASAFAPFTEGMMREVAEDVSFKTVERARHRIPEENAEGPGAEIPEFIGPG